LAAFRKDLPSPRWKIVLRFRTSNAYTHELISGVCDVWRQGPGGFKTSGA
jgi:hypothetical protein